MSCLHKYFTIPLLQLSCRVSSPCLSCACFCPSRGSFANDFLWRLTHLVSDSIYEPAVLLQPTWLSEPRALHAACALHVQTNESWAGNIFLDCSKEFLLQTVSLPIETLSMQCDLSSQRHLDMNGFKSSRWVLQNIHGPRGWKEELAYAWLSIRSTDQPVAVPQNSWTVLLSFDHKHVALISS